MLNPQVIVSTMLDVHKQTISDIQLLSYMYKIYLEAIRRDTQTVQHVSVGPVILKCWQSAAKTIERRDERIELWGTLFKTALYEDLWDDARFVSCPLFTLYRSVS
jgi:N-terminal acetyltransferase B complex non-catalytic subunit